MTAVRRWQRLTAPHPDVQGLSNQRRARLAAALLLFLIPVAALYLAVYEWANLVTKPGRDSWLVVGVLASIVAGYVLVRGPRFERGIWLVTAVILLTIWHFVISEADAELLMYTLMPLLLGSLLMDLRAATLLTAANLAAAAAYTAGIGWATEEGDAFLFLLAVSPLVLVGTGFMDRSIQDLHVANERLRHSDAARLQLLSTVGHDLSSPLTPIRLQLELLQGNTDVPRAELDRRLAVLQRNVDLMRRLVGDIADLAKVEAGRLSILPHDVDLSLLVQEAAEAFQHRAREQGIRLATQLEGPVMVQADSERLTAVLYNLLTNALKFTSHGQIDVRVETQGPHALVHVRDTGRGLAVDELGRLWQPFSQVHHPKEVSERGTGLGLFISKGIVEAHGGRVWVTSPGRGHGSTFTISLPRLVPTMPLPVPHT